MLRQLQARLTYANVTATLALFIALGGGAYAAIDLVGRNDIKSRHIAPSNVKRSDVDANAVNSAKVADRSLRLRDIVVAQGTRTIDPNSLLANQCGQFNATGGVFSRVRPGDAILVFTGSPSLHSGMVPYEMVQNNSGQGAVFTLCNTTNSTFDEDPTEFKLVVLR